MDKKVLNVDFVVRVDKQNLLIDKLDELEREGIILKKKIVKCGNGGC